MQILLCVWHVYVKQQGLFYVANDVVSCINSCPVVIIKLILSFIIKCFIPSVLFFACVVYTSLLYPTLTSLEGDVILCFGFSRLQNWSDKSTNLKFIAGIRPKLTIFKISISLHFNIYQIPCNDICTSLLYPTLYSANGVSYCALTFHD